MIAIIDYEAGNLTSVARALRHIGVECEITGKHEVIRASERVIFPGVGAAGEAMDAIRREGLDGVIREVIAAGTPFLGICLGAQIILDESEEDGCTPCLGIIPGKAREFGGSDIKVPHMGWNNISVTGEHPVFAGVDARAQFYFVHSYYVLPEDETTVALWCEYGGVRFAAAVAFNNVFAVQFHPEKSQAEGIALLERFVEM